MKSAKLNAESIGHWQQTGIKTDIQSRYFDNTLGVCERGGRLENA